MVPNLKKSNVFLPSIINNFFWRDDFPTFLDDKMHMPAINMVEHEKEFRVEVAAPELEKEDLKVKIESNILEIFAEKETQKEEKCKNSESLYHECNYTSFFRTFSLPKEVDAEKIEVKQKEEMIEITLPKKGK